MSILTQGSIRVITGYRLPALPLGTITWHVNNMVRGDTSYESFSWSAHSSRQILRAGCKQDISLIRPVEYTSYHYDADKMSIVSRVNVHKREWSDADREREQRCNVSRYFPALNRGYIALEQDIAQLPSMRALQKKLWKEEIRLDQLAEYVRNGLIAPATAFDLIKTLLTKNAETAWSQSVDIFAPVFEQNDRRSSKFHSTLYLLLASLSVFLGSLHLSTPADIMFFCCSVVTLFLGLRELDKSSFPMSLFPNAVRKQNDVRLRELALEVAEVSARGMLSNGAQTLGEDPATEERTHVLKGLLLSAQLGRHADVETLLVGQVVQSLKHRDSIEGLYRALFPSEESARDNPLAILLRRAAAEAEERLETSREVSETIGGESPFSGSHVRVASLAAGAAHLEEQEEEEAVIENETVALNAER